jgi:hypothetical protein
VIFTAFIERIPSPAVHSCCHLGEEDAHVSGWTANASPAANPTTAAPPGWCADRNTPRFANSKVVMPPDDLVKADNFDLSPDYDTALAASRYQGGLDALPFKIHPGPLVAYYDVQHLQEVGLSLPDQRQTVVGGLEEANTQLGKYDEAPTGKRPSFTSENSQQKVDDRSGSACMYLLRPCNSSKRIVTLSTG